MAQELEGVIIEELEEEEKSGKEFLP